MVLMALDALVASGIPFHSLVRASVASNVSTDLNVALTCLIVALSISISSTSVLQMTFKSLDGSDKSRSLFEMAFNATKALSDGFCSFVVRAARSYQILIVIFQLVSHEATSVADCWQPFVCENKPKWWSRLSTFVAQKQFVPTFYNSVTLTTLLSLVRTSI